VFAGMLGVTLFGIFLTPVFYYVIQRLKDHNATQTVFAFEEELSGGIRHSATSTDPEDSAGREVTVLP
jgi:multidrug efflux pump